MVPADTNDGLTIAYTVLMSFFVFVGMIGNLASIFVIVILKEYQKSVTHWYVLQLSIANFFFILTIPFKILEQLRDTWSYSETWCKTNQTIFYLNYNVSIFFLMVMSIDRYIAVCLPLSSRLQQLRKRISAFKISMCLWVIAFLLCIPVMLYSFKSGIYPKCHCTFEFEEPPKTGSDYDYCSEVFSDHPEHYETCLKNTYTEILESDEKHCRRIVLPDEKDLFSGLYDGDIDYDSYFGVILQPSNDTSTSTEDDTISTCHFNSNAQLWFGVIMFNFLGMFVVPALVMIICYGLIVRRLFQTRMTRTTSTSSSVSFTHSLNSGQGGVQKRKRKLTARSDKDRIRVTAMCAILVVSFFALWLPFHTNQVGKWVGLNLSTSACHTFDIVSLIFAYMSAAVYPYLYAFLGTRFSRRFHTATTTFRKSISKRKRSSASSGSFHQLHRKNTSTNQTCVSKLNRTETNPRIYVGTVDTTDTLDKHTKHSLCENSSPEYQNTLAKTDQE